ncbi:hypothetical protein [Amycolatopsis magusensis]|uniref:hypothetical protein n=1 Tax=Amycolatopsis magusensis TaxID=882444 RepID=UPI0037B9E0D2
MPAGELLAWWEAALRRTADAACTGRPADVEDYWTELAVGTRLAAEVTVGAVHTAITPANIEKLDEGRWFAETHWFGVGGDSVDHRATTFAVVREISVRRQAGVPGIIHIDRTTNAVSFVPFD